MINLIKYFYRQINGAGIISAILMSTNIPLFLLYFLATKSIIYENYIPLIMILNIVCFINQIDRILKHDFDTGILEHLLASNEIIYLVIIKSIFYFLILNFSMLTNLIILFVTFGYKEYDFIWLTIGIFGCNIIFTSVLILMSSIRLYFERNSSIISASILPFMFAPFIILGSYLKTSENIFVNILIGVSFVIAPVFLYFSKILVKDIYNN